MSTTTTGATPTPSAASSTTTTTRPSHPAAQAFFAALDISNNAEKQSDNDDDNDNVKSTSRRKRPEKRKSDFIRKRLSSLGWRNRHSQDPYYPITVLETKFSVLQMQRGEIEETYGTGACVWPAAVVLLKYLEHQAEATKNDDNLVAGKNVVDLGSGTAVTSIAAAILGAHRVICTDGCDKVVQLARDNIFHAKEEIDGIVGGDGGGCEESSFLPTAAAAATVPDNQNDANDATTTGCTIRGCRIDVQELWWGRDSIDYLDHGAADVDVVLCADCVLPKLYPIGPLVQVIDELLVKPNAVALFSYEHRHYPEYDPRDKFRQLAAAKGLVVESIPLEEQSPVFSLDDVELWNVYRKRR